MTCQPKGVSTTPLVAPGADKATAAATNFGSYDVDSPGLATRPAAVRGRAPRRRASRPGAARRSRGRQSHPRRRRRALRLRWRLRRPSPLPLHARQAPWGGARQRARRRRSAGNLLKPVNGTDGTNLVVRRRGGSRGGAEVVDCRAARRRETGEGHAGGVVEVPRLRPCAAAASSMRSARARGGETLRAEATAATMPTGKVTSPTRATIDPRSCVRGGSPAYGAARGQREHEHHPKAMDRAAHGRGFCARAADARKATAPDANQ